MIVAIAAVLLAAAAAFGVRLVVGPSLADRVIALDGLLVTGMAGIAAHAAHTGNGAFVPVIVVTTFVGFISTAIIARFIERSGR